MFTVVRGEYIRQSLESAINLWWERHELPNADLLRDGLVYLEQGGQLSEGQRAILLRAALSYAKGVRTALRHQTNPERTAVLLNDSLLMAGSRWSEDDLREMGIEPATARRHFQRRFDMSFSQYARARRLGHAFNAIRKGDAVIEAQLDAGFESGSGFREAFSRTFGEAPNKSREALAFAMDWIDTPLGPMLAIADDTHLHMLEFVERKKLQDHVERYRKAFNATVLPGDTKALRLIRKELADYFSGKNLDFKSKVAGAGTEFQNDVWNELRRVPPGVTRSYQEMAERIGRPSAVRAVANANRLNRCAIILPCHRVIGADGTLTGYAGGLWRKQWLLDHEKRHTGQTLL